MGGYHAGAFQTEVWRIEEDDSVNVEIISPIMNMKLFLKEIPIVARIMRKIGFTSNVGVGYHINVSSTELDLTVSGTVTALYLLARKTKYGYFGALAFLSYQQEEGFFRSGARERMKSEYTKTFSEYIANSSRFYDLNKLITLYKKLIKEKLTNKGSKETIFIISLDDFWEQVSKDLKQVAREFSGRIEKGSHYVSVSARTNRIELRGLGGSKGFSALQSSASLGATIRKGLAYLIPIISVEEFSNQQIEKATIRFIRSFMEKEFKIILKAINPHLPTKLVEIKIGYPGEPSRLE